MALDKITADLTVIKSNTTFTGTFTTSVSGEASLSYGDLTTETTNTPSHTYTDIPPYLINVKDNVDTITGIAISGNDLDSVGIVPFENLTNLDVSNNLLNRASIGDLIADMAYYSGQNGTLDISGNIEDTSWSNNAIASYYELTASKGWAVTGFDGLWSPSQLSSTVWLDAADPDTITMATGISQWDDKSGNGNHFTQGNSALQPEYNLSDSMLNNRRTVYSHGTTLHRLECINSVGFKRLYMVVYFGDGTETTWPNHNAILSGPSYRLTGRANDDHVWDGNRASNNFDYNGSTYRNGSTVDTNYEDNGLPMPKDIFRMEAPATLTQTWWVMGGSPSYTNWEGGLGELIVTDGTEDFATEQKVEGYLAHKWGLTDILPSIHPYKTEAPLL